MSEPNEPINQDAHFEQPETSVAKNEPKATYKEEHTANNTTFADYVPPEPFITKLYTPEESKKVLEQGYLTYFLGNTKKVIEEANEIIANWVEYTSAELDFMDGEIKESAFNAIKNKWNEFSAVKFPGMDETEILDYCRKLYAFNNELLDTVKVRSKVMREKGITNMNDRGGLTTGDVIGKKPRRNNAPDLVERMRIQSIGAQEEEYQFDILLRNSFVFLTIRRPSRLKLAELIREVHQTVKGYVRSTNNPTINLSYLAAVRALWNYITTLIINCSVKDITDFKQLEDIILINDVEALAVGLSKASMNKGHNVQLHCLERGCGWVGVGLADPAKLLQKRDNLITKEEAAIYANISNSRLKLTVQQVRELQRKSAYIEDNRVYNEQRTYYLEIEPPSLRVGFEALDQVADSINPRIQKLRANSTQEEFEAQLQDLLINVSPMEYIHWVARAASPGETAEEDDIIERYGNNQASFNEGLMVVLEDDSYLANRLANKVRLQSPFMSRTYCAVGYFECPECKKNSKEHDEIGLGYTPINPLMNFFTLTQLKMINEMQTLTKSDEAL